MRRNSYLETYGQKSDLAVRFGDPNFLFLSITEFTITKYLITLTGFSAAKKLSSQNRSTKWRFFWNLRV